MIRTHNLGFPRIGEKREYKKATEAYWKNKLSLEGLKANAAELREQHWQKQKDAGLAWVPTFDFASYDHILSTSMLLGVIPERFRSHEGELTPEDLMFKIARGESTWGDQGGASELTKWFDTNYHYIVPELDGIETFALKDDRLFRETKEAIALGHSVKPVLIGPVTYLYLGKFYQGDNTFARRLERLPALCDAYETILERLHRLGVSWVQLDEPVCAVDIDDEILTKLEMVLKRLRKKTIALGPVGGEPRMKIMLTTYFNSITHLAQRLFTMDADVFHIDLTKTALDEDKILVECWKKANAPDDGKELSLGIINGRNVWRADLPAIAKRLSAFQKELSDFLIAPSCSLMHVPITLRHEKQLGVDVRSLLAFAEEKLAELATLKSFLNGTLPEAELTTFMGTVVKQGARLNTRVRERVAKIMKSDVSRQASLAQRKKKQQTSLKLPLFPTTTVGSFPQTPEIRRARRQYKKGEISTQDYEGFLKKEIASVVKRQEQIGFDVLVHGEAERNDMVEYFADKLTGYAFSENGWVQSFGTRCVKPPIIYGDIERPKPMTVAWAQYAQSLSEKPVKGMLTGPITMLQWSFVREDQPREETAMELALACQDEVQDLEAAGIKIIQLDEPALREGLPLHQEAWATYLEWAVRAFKVCTMKVLPETQIQTHMCYSYFSDIIASIIALDADVILIESSRSKMSLLRTLTDYDYPGDIGPGIYDIHSPRVPEVQEMSGLLEKALQVLKKEQLWVTPDCGLKTREWPEVEASLRNLIASTQVLREKTLR